MAGITQPRSISEFSLGKIIGRGAFAKVCLALDKKAKTRVVFKIFEKENLLSNDRRKSILSEIGILRNSSHPNIIQLLSCLETKLQVILMFEYNCAISMDFAIKLQKNQRYAEPMVKDLFRQMVNVIEFLHANNIVHRDIKLKNMLMTSNNTVQLIDFGFSRKLFDGEIMEDFCGTPNYISPEIVNRENYYPKAADIWALGVVLYKLFTGKLPFDCKVFLFYC